MANESDEVFMRKEFLPFSRPSITEKDIEAVSQVLRSGWITTGSKTSEFEDRFKEYVGCSHAVALSSATAGMHLILEALDIGPGDEVITSSMTWVSTVNLIVLSGATPVFVDIDRDTLMVLPDSMERALSDRTRLIVPVHFAGAAADLDVIGEIANTRGIPVVEDAAHALGTFYKGRHVGSRGTAIFSFHPIKNITTGEGGMFCSDDKELADRIRRLKFHGLGVDAYDRHTQGRSPQAQVMEPGYKYNMPDMCAVLGTGQLERIQQLNKKRAQLASRYLQLLSEMDEILPLSVPENTTGHAWHLFIIRLHTDKAKISRDVFMEKTQREEYRDGTSLPGGASTEILSGDHAVQPRYASQHGMEFGPHLFPSALSGYDL